jgi:hypothetical protein
LRRCLRGKDPRCWRYRSLRDGRILDRILKGRSKGAMVYLWEVLDVSSTGMSQWMIYSGVHISRVTLQLGHVKWECKSLLCSSFKEMQPQKAGLKQASRASWADWAVQFWGADHVRFMANHVSSASPVRSRPRTPPLIDATW